MERISDSFKVKWAADSIQHQFVELLIEFILILRGYGIHMVIFHHSADTFDASPSLLCTPVWCEVRMIWLTSWVKASENVRCCEQRSSCTCHRWIWTNTSGNSCHNRSQPVLVPCWYLHGQLYHWNSASSAKVWTAYESHPSLSRGKGRASSELDGQHVFSALTIVTGGPKSRFRWHWCSHCNIQQPPLSPPSPPTTTNYHQNQGRCGSMGI